MPLGKASRECPVRVWRSEGSRSSRMPCLVRGVGSVCLQGRPQPELQKHIVEGFLQGDRPKRLRESVWSDRRSTLAAVRHRRGEDSLPLVDREPSVVFRSIADRFCLELLETAEGVKARKITASIRYPNHPRTQPSTPQISGEVGIRDSTRAGKGDFCCLHFISLDRRENLVLANGGARRCLQWSPQLI
jgi:hypothetical protein